MSPIGRIFIVLNLALAGGFVVFAGNLLKQQDNYKQKLSKEEAAHQQTKEANAREIENLKQERNKFEVASTSNRSQLDANNVALAKAEDDKKRLEQITGQQAADLKAMRSLAEANDVRVNAAMIQAKEAYDASIAAIAGKDEAVRAKDASDAENRTLNTTIASLNEKIEGKNLALAALKRDNDEQGLLVAAAIANGFSPGMASPTLAGTVTNVSESGKLCTIAVSDNPGNVDIQDQILRRPFTIAISDESGYKAEAVATRYEAGANAILCNIRFTKVGAGRINPGDRASTK